MLSRQSLLSTTAVAQTPQASWESGTWQFAATVYAFLPSIGGSVDFPVASGGASINVDADKIIGGLNFTFMGTFEAHNGRWGVFTDVLYLDVGGSKSNTRDFSIGRIGLPASTTANLDLDLKGFIWTLAGEYRVVSDPAWTVDMLAGARLFAVKPTLGWSINGELGPIGFPVGSGSKEISQDVWDGIIGVKGRYAFGDNRAWFMPFYLDVGTGAVGGDVARRRRAWLYLQLGIRHGHVAVSRLPIQIGAGDRSNELQWPDARGDVSLVSSIDCLLLENGHESVTLGRVIAACPAVAAGRLRHASDQRADHPDRR